MRIKHRSISARFTGYFTLAGSSMFRCRIVRYLSLLVASCFVLLYPAGSAFAAVPAQADSVAVYVSPDGNDSWSGSLPQPNADRTNGPLRTIQSALDRITSLSEDPGRANVRFEVLIRQGVYYVPDGLHLHFVSQKSSSLLIGNYPGEFVTITGGLKLSHFKLLSESNVKSPIRPEFAKDVYVCNLKDAGVDNFGEITQRGHPPMQLFFHDSLMTIARYPNKGWLTIAGVPQSGKLMYKFGLERERRYDGVPVGRNFGKIEYPGNRPDSWSRSDEVYVHGYWTWDWFDSYKRVSSFDFAAHTMHLSPAEDPYGYTKNQRFYFLNVPEELDTAGEWYVDKASGNLYFWPTDGIESAAAEVSIAEAPLLHLSDCSHVSISGIYFDIARGNGVVIDGGRGNAVEGCVLRNIGGHAVVVNGGFDNGIRSSIVSDIGLDAIVVAGGDRKTLTPGHDYVRNNDVKHFGAWVQTMHGIVTSGVGDYVEHNDIFDAPFEGLYISGNNQLVAYNNFHDICRQSGDAGAMHTGRDWTWRGNVVKYNYFHDLKGPGLHGVMGVYLDDWTCGFTVYGNVFDHADHAVFIGGGRDNIVKNNVFIGCSPSVSIDGRGFSWGSYYFNGGDGAQLFDEMIAMNYARNPYKKAYPLLATFTKTDPAAPLGNEIMNNISCDGRWMDIHDYGTFKLSIIHEKDNVVADPKILRRRIGNQIGWDPYYLNLETDSGYVILSRDNKKAREELPGNIYMSNPDVARIVGGKLEISKAALKYGFKPIPFSEIGTHNNPMRELAKWIDNAVRK